MNENITIEFVENEAVDALQPLIGAGLREIEESGFGDGSNSDMSGKYHVGWVAKIDGETVGILLYTDVSGTGLKRWWISLSYVKPEHRRKGIHGMLFNRLKEHAKEVGVKAIDSGTHIFNRTSQRSMESQGRFVWGHIYRYEVE